LGGYEDAYERNGYGLVELVRRKGSVVAMEFGFGNAKGDFLLTIGSKT
jgi:hypothetical protein